MWSGEQSSLFMRRCIHAWRPEEPQQWREMLPRGVERSQQVIVFTAESYPMAAACVCVCASAETVPLHWIDVRRARRRQLSGGAEAKLPQWQQAAQELLQVNTRFCSPRLCGLSRKTDVQLSSFIN